MMASQAEQNHLLRGVMGMEILEGVLHVRSSVWGFYFELLASC